MEELLSILRNYNDEIDINTKGIIDDELIDSIDIVSLISELEDTFDIRVQAEDISAENLNTPEAMWQMVLRLQKKRM